MPEQFSRTELLLGPTAMEKLKNSTVAVFGIGGVGGHASEALARSGVGTLVLTDNDTVSESNINRQLYATHSSVGRYKVDVAKERLLDINPSLNIIINNTFYLPENAHQFDFSSYDYIIDAVDTVTAKISLIESAANAHVPIISSMGAGNKLNPALFEVADIYETSVCPLAKVMRHELRKRGIKHLKVVYSKEQPIKPDIKDADKSCHKQTPGSVAFVPSVAGLIAAGEVIRSLCDI